MNQGSGVYVCLASSVGQVVGRSDACSLMCAGGPGSIHGTDNLHLGFHPFGVGEINSSQYVDGRPLQETAELERTAVRWSRVAFAARGAHWRTWFLGG